MNVERLSKDRWAVALAVGVSALVSAVALYVWDSWILNFDGSGYLTLSRALRESGAYRFPDGSFATFRGPGFAGFLAAGQMVVGGSIKNAVWIGRSVLIINAVLVALLVWRASRDALAAGVAGATVAVMPWTFVSGATGLVPDALAAGFVLAGVAALWTNRYHMHVVSGVLFGAAVLTKETGVFGLVAALLIVFVRTGSTALLSGVIAGFALPLTLWWMVALGVTGHLPAPFERIGGAAGWSVVVVVMVGALATVTLGRLRQRTLIVRAWAVATGLVLLPVVTLVALVVGVGPLPDDRGGLIEAAGDALIQELYQGTTWWPLLVVSLLAVLWAIRSAQAPLAFSGLALLGVGLGATMYAGSGHFGVRNGVLVAYAIAILTGFAVASTRQARRARVFVLVAAAALFVGNVQGTASVDERSADQLLTEQNAVVAAAAKFFSEQAPTSVLTTPTSGASVSVQTADGVEFSLVPMYVSANTEWPQQVDQLVHWLSQVQASQPIGVDPVAISVSSNRLTAVGASALFSALDEVDYVMLTGNARFNATPFDGGVLLPFFDAAPSATRVWEQINEGSQWIVIYELAHPFVAGDVDPIYRSADGAPIDGVDALDLVEYSELVKSLVAAQ